MTNEEKLVDYPIVREALEKREEQLRDLMRLVSAAEILGKDSVPIEFVKEAIFEKNVEDKMDNLLLSLTDREREVLAKKLDGEGNA